MIQKHMLKCGCMFGQCFWTILCIKWPPFLSSKLAISCDWLYNAGLTCTDKYLLSEESPDYWDYWVHPEGVDSMTAFRVRLFTDISLICY